MPCFRCVKRLSLLFAFALAALAPAAQSQGVLAALGGKANTAVVSNEQVRAE